jgi:anaerobic nitric oxide reductase transcription regulator
LELNRSRLGLGSLRLDADAQAALLAHPWPGNVRELEHLIARSALKAQQGAAPRARIVSLTAVHLDLAHGLAPPPNGQNLPQNTTTPVDLRTSLDDHQRQRIAASLQQHGGNWASVARELGLHRANLVRLARRLGLRAS